MPKGFVKLGAQEICEVRKKERYYVVAGLVGCKTFVTSRVGTRVSVGAQAARDPVSPVFSSNQHCLDYVLVRYVCGSCNVSLRYQL